MFNVLYERPLEALALPVISKSLASPRNETQMWHHAILHNPTHRNIAGPWWGHQPFENFLIVLHALLTYLCMVVHCIEGPRSDSRNCKLHVSCTVYG